MDYKTLFGIFAVFIAVFAYIPYFRDIYLGKTKPHMYSWIVWGILTFSAFGIQVADNAGPGAWTTGFTAVLCLAIIILAYSIIESKHK